jgi:hypothetical protein
VRGRRAGWRVVVVVVVLVLVVAVVDEAVIFRVPYSLMKAYLITTGMLFALLAGAHLLRTIAEWQRLAAEPSFIVEGPGIGVVAGALSFWSWRLLRRVVRS